MKHLHILFLALGLPVVGWTQSSALQPDTVAGKCISFDASTSQHVDTRFNQYLPYFTVMAWVKSPNAPDGRQGCGPVHYENNFQMNWNHVSNSFRGAIGFHDSTNWYATKFGDLQADRWYHLCGTYDGDTLRAFRDGVLVSKNGGPQGPARQEANSVKLGRHAILSGPQEHFEGFVDEVRIYDHALPADSIRLQMYMATGPTGGLVLHHQLNATGTDSLRNVVDGRAAIKVGNPTSLPSDVFLGMGTAELTNAAPTTNLARGSIQFNVHSGQARVLGVRLRNLDSLSAAGFPHRSSPIGYSLRFFDSTSTFVADSLQLAYESSIVNALPGTLLLAQRLPGNLITRADTSTFASVRSGYLLIDSAIEGEHSIHTTRVVSIRKQKSKVACSILYTNSGWQLTADAPIQKAYLSDISGRTVSNGIITGNKCLLYHHTPGLFLIRIETSKGANTFRVVSEE